MIVFHIGIVMRGADLDSGFRFNSLATGTSVASARAAMVSWNRFTHMSCTGVRTDFSFGFAIAEMNVNKMEVRVIVI